MARSKAFRAEVDLPTDSPAEAARSRPPTQIDRRSGRAHRRRMRGRWTSAGVLALAISGCGSDPLLFVRVRTDFLAEREFSEVRITVVASGAASGRTFTHEATTSEDYLESVSVADVPVRAGDVVELEVELRRAGATVLGRRVTVAIDDDSRVVRVPLTRDCFGVSCEEATGACLNARCVDPSCTLENPGECLDALCDTSADCVDDGAACSSPLCREGICQEVPDDAMCAATERCVPSRGCVPEEDLCPVLRVIEHEDGALMQDTEWEPAIHVLPNGLYLDATLRVAACSVLRVGPGGSIAVANTGRLLLSGEAGREILVTASNPGADPGSWRRLSFAGPSGASEIMHTTIEAGGDGGPMILVSAGASVTIHDTRVTRALGVGMVVERDARLLALAGNAFTDNGDVGLQIDATVVGQLAPSAYGPNAREGILVDGNTIRGDARWIDLGTPYVMRGRLDVSTPTGVARLTIAEGVELAMERDATLVVGDNGGLAMLGTAAAPIEVRSSLPTPSPGDWQHIELFGTSLGIENRIENTILRHGGGGSYGMVLVRSGTSLTSRATQLLEFAGYGLEVEGEVDVEGCVIADGTGAPMSLPAAQVGRVRDCTIERNAIEPIVVSDGYFQIEAEWQDHGVPYALTSQLDVRGPPDVGSALLTLAPGVVILVPPGNSIHVGTRGALAANGTPTERVTITSASPAPSAGDWSGLWIQDGSIGAQNVLRNTLIEYGNGWGYGTLRVSGRARVTLDAVEIRQSVDACDVTTDPEAVVDATGSTYTTCP